MSEQTQDHERTKLVTSGANMDGEHVFAKELAELVGGPLGALHTQEFWHDYWDDLGIAPGNYNDRTFAWLGTLAFTGGLNDRLHDFWESP